MRTHKAMIKMVTMSVIVVLIAACSVLAAPPEQGVNLAAQKTYVLEAKQPSKNYPDPNGVKLTDGNLAVEAVYHDSAWVGVWDVAPFVVNIDLGNSQLISSVRTHFLAGNAGTKYPEMISVTVSDDNNNWSDTVSMSIFDPVPTTGTVKWFTVSDINLKGRYVRLSYTPPKAGTNIFIDEIEIY